MNTTKMGSFMCNCVIRKLNLKGREDCKSLKFALGAHLGFKQKGTLGPIK